MPDEKNTSESNEFDPRRMIELEEELIALKQKQGIEEKPKWWQRLGDWYADYTVRSKVLVNRKKYIRLAWTCGWLCGSHRFYAHKPVLGTLYLLFFWTGAPFAMTLIDLMIALPMRPDENGMILI